MGLGFVEMWGLALAHRFIYYVDSGTSLGLCSGQKLEKLGPRDLVRMKNDMDKYLSIINDTKMFKFVHREEDSWKKKHLYEVKVTKRHGNGTTSKWKVASVLYVVNCQDIIHYFEICALITIRCPYFGSCV